MFETPPIIQSHIIYIYIYIYALRLRRVRASTMPQNNHKFLTSITKYLFHNCVRFSHSRHVRRYSRCRIASVL